MTRTHDLLIAGGGPAGLATALYAVRAGFDVVLAEPRPMPVDKACGEGLMPGAVRELRALGLDVPGRPIVGIRYRQGPHQAQAEFRHGPGLGVRRTALHAVLHTAVLAAGVPVLPVRVQEVHQGARSVSDRATGVRARWLVAADGLHSPVRRSLGLGMRDAGAPRYGLRRHYAVAPPSPYVEVHWGPQGEAYVTPLGPRLLGVALLTSRRASFDEQLTGFPELAAALPRDAAVGGVRGAGPLRQKVRSRVHGRVMLVGDAAGYIDALTGEGVSLALAGARVLIDQLRRGSPRGYEAAWRRATFRHRLLTDCLVRARQHPWLADKIVPAASRLPPVFSLAVNALA
ncbi:MULTISPECIES: NAD(P)/FAD-dependent oxidoreductase [Streptomyces]|uniref:Oxidoreductase n=1 Tax=Streptomyces venezuelae (strain ATCC 10712 / CBS 650.69 / DSM 40230 / JCM 4526 / NBRC 13096 / PD 04745) TaxID=953739 RepID=F2RLZ9_STRVP|nr:NAD(P)/FAD-dependent oxidoreductase [Streptomyces venezuelae]APE25838.1 monooxygenase [Streptomyces venezuelae]QES03176.1 NAD(P)/FAD-dependent oxidoreductase [Streptomyces venezuelae ATCC 10712]CCA60529.1 oxidoreductase [Streptomyces venezuelae ATCC 10712]